MFFLNNFVQYVGQLLVHLRSKLLFKFQSISFIKTKKKRITNSIYIITEFQKLTE